MSVDAIPPSELGGDPPCWAHLFEVDDRADIAHRDDLRCLMVDFYRRALMDDVLGPVFEAQVHDWARHIDTVSDFWAWQLLGERGYQGHPLRSHEPLHAVSPLTRPMFERWVELFCDTIDDRFAGPVAELAKTRGRKMAAAMERLLRGVSGDASEAVDVMRPTTVR